MQAAGAMPGTHASTSDAGGVTFAVQDVAADRLTAGPAITLTTPTPAPAHTPQLGTPFLVPDFPPGHLSPTLDPDLHAIDYRRHDPVLGGGWRRRASWALGTGSFQQANAEAGLLPSPIEPQVNPASDADEAQEESAALPPLSPTRPFLRRNGVTMPDLLAALGISTDNAITEHGTVRESEEVWRYRASQITQLEAERFRRFLAGISKRAASRRTSSEVADVPS